MRGRGLASWRLTQPNSLLREHQWLACPSLPLTTPLCFPLLHPSSKPVEGDGSSASSSKPSGLQHIKNVLYRTLQSAGMSLEESSPVSQDVSEQPDEVGGEDGTKWNPSPDPTHKFSSSHESLHVSMGEHSLECHYTWVCELQQ